MTASSIFLPFMPPPLAAHALQLRSSVGSVTLPSLFAFALVQQTDLRRKGCHLSTSRAEKEQRTLSCVMLLKKKKWYVTNVFRVWLQWIGRAVKDNSYHHSLRPSALQLLQSQGNWRKPFRCTQLFNLTLLQFVTRSPTTSALQFPHSSPSCQSGLTSPIFF